MAWKPHAYLQGTFFVTGFGTTPGPHQHSARGHRSAKKGCGGSSPSTPEGAGGAKLPGYEAREYGVAFREKDELDWRVFGTYGLVMSYAQEFEFGLSLTIGHYRRELAKTDEQLWELWKRTAGQLLRQLKGHVPSPVLEDLERLVTERNWLAHDFFVTYSFDRRKDEGTAQEALQRLDRLAQDFKDASIGLVALRTRITPGLDSDEKIRMLWAKHGPTPPTV
jgi:hypothetical protein